MNPGKPLVDTKRFIDFLPRSRNEELASLLRRIGVCEERGSGVDKAIDVIEVPPAGIRSDGRAPSRRFLVQKAFCYRTP